METMFNTYCIDLEATLNTKASGVPVKVNKVHVYKFIVSNSQRSMEVKPTTSIPNLNIYT